MNNNHEDSQRARNLKGIYTNYFKIGYNAFEFLLDFGQLYNGHKRPQYHTRIITSPVYAKTLLALLQNSIEQYEQSFGAIAEEDGSSAD